MGILDYEPGRMEELASSLISTAVAVMAERSSLPKGSSPLFVGPAATQFFDHCERQRHVLDAAYGDLMATAAKLQMDAADVRRRQAAERKAIAEARAALEARSRAEAAERARRAGGTA